MASETTCPTCNADIPLAGDEKNGEELFCTVCGAASLLRGNATDEVVDAEEDF